MNNKIIDDYNVKCFQGQLLSKMKIKNLYSVIIIILSLCHTSDIFADKSKIPTCYISPEIFDSDLNSYEDYILNKCFDKFGDHIKKGSYLSKKEFLTKIEQDKEFERFIYLYVFIRDYLFRRSWNCNKLRLHTVIKQFNIF